MLNCKVKVWNDNVHDFEQDFKGVKIKIPAGKFVEMDFYDGSQFLQKFYPPVVDGMGRHDPRGFKMLRLDPPIPDFSKDKEDAEDEEFKCHSCGEKHDTWKSLEKHIINKHADVAVKNLDDVDNRAKTMKQLPRL
jgi:hypothetical protein